MRAHFLDVDHFAHLSTAPLPFALFSSGAGKATLLLAPPNAQVAAKISAADLLAFRHSPRNPKPETLYSETSSFKTRACLVTRAYCASSTHGRAHSHSTFF